MEIQCVCVGGDLESDHEGGNRPSSGYRKGWGEESGRQSHTSRPGSRVMSRPGSTHGVRPGSSLRRSGRGLERGKGNRTETDTEVCMAHTL